MWVSDIQILQSVRASLARLAADLAGTESGKAAASQLNAINIAVGELAARADGRTDSLRESCADAKRLATRGAALSAVIENNAFSARAQAPGEAPQSGLAEIDASYSITKQLLTECSLSLSAAIVAGKGDANWQHEVRAFFLQLAKHDAQRSALDAATPAIDQGSSKSGELDVESLKRYFAACKGTPRLPGPFELIETKPLAGGFSRQTILIKVRNSKNEVLPLVIRKQVPNGFLDGACNTLLEEIPFFRLCNEHKLQVPELYWHETDASIIDGEFFVVECMPGGLVGSSYQMAEGIGDDFLKALAQMMAAIHQIDWTPFENELRASSRVPEAEPVNASSTAMAMVLQFESYWRKANLEPLPTMELMVDWLKHNIPKNNRNAVLGPGDIGFHNLLVHEGKISALLDWETSRLADPARDMSYMYTMVTHYIAWDKFMGWYREAGGAEIDQASLDYYGVFCAFAHIIVCEVAMGDTFPRSGNPNLGYLHLGIPIKAYFFNEMLRDGAPIWGKQ